MQGSSKDVIKEATKEIAQDAGKDLAKDKSKEKSKEKDQSQSLGAEGQDVKKSRVKKTAGEDKGLVQKTRTSSKKGLSI